jgi:hypothetical protein
MDENAPVAEQREAKTDALELGDGPGDVAQLTRAIWKRHGRYGPNET